MYASQNLYDSITTHQIVSMALYKYSYNCKYPYLIITYIRILTIIILV